MATQTKERRGPGRPPRVVSTTHPIRGVVSEPDDELNVVELSHYNPSLFKQLITLMKNLKCRELFFKFKPNGLTILCRDHPQNRIVVKFDVDRALHYYCKKELSISVDRDMLQAVFAHLNKNISFILITFESNGEVLKFKLNDEEIKKIKTRSVGVNMKHPDDNLQEVEKDIEEANISLSFYLTTRDFKDTVADAASYGERIFIEKCGEGPLILKLSNVKDIGIETYMDGTKIGLECELEEKEVYSCSLHTILLKSLAISVASTIYFRCMHGNRAILSTKIADLVDFTIYAERIMGTNN